MTEEVVARIHARIQKAKTTARVLTITATVVAVFTLVLFIWSVATWDPIDTFPMVTFLMTFAVLTYVCSERAADMEAFLALLGHPAAGPVQTEPADDRFMIRED